jgi:hypothetical protein
LKPVIGGFRGGEDLEVVGVTDLMIGSHRVSNGDQVSRVAALAMKRASPWTSPATDSATLLNAAT